MAERTRCFSVAELLSLARKALERHGAPTEVAAAVSQVLVEADMRGVASHGVARLPNYIQRLQHGLINANAQPELVHALGGLGIMDGHNGFGAHAALAATDKATELAARYGVAWISVRNSNHFGPAAAYTKRLAERGFAAICLSNAAPAAAAYGGRKAVLGTNPISMAIPGDGSPIVLDMATTVVARGKIRQAARRNETIAEGLALDADGQPTTDPHRALAGTLAPIGGPKGYGLALMIDLMTGFFAKGHSSSEIGETSDFNRPSRTCFTLIAVSTEHMGKDEAGDRIGQIIAMVRASADTPSAIRLPGEIEDAHSADASARGVVIASALAAEIETLARPTDTR